MNCRETIRKDNLRHYGFGTEVMKQIKVCPQCGARADPAERFCGECGARLPDETLYDSYRQRHRVCPECDSALSQTDEYCPCCGTRTK